LAPGQFASFTEFGVAIGNHYVEAPVAAFFFGLNQAEGAQFEEVKLNPMQFGWRQAAALQVHGNAGEVGRGCVAVDRSGIAIVTAELLLDLDGADGRVELNGMVELGAEVAAQVLHKVARPGTAVAALRRKLWRDVQVITFAKWDEIVRCDQLFQFVIVLDARQLQAVDFCVLAEQGIVRRAEDRVPVDTDATAARFGAGRCRHGGLGAMYSAVPTRGAVLHGLARGQSLAGEPEERNR
jgi:hypothetical protein